MCVCVRVYAMIVKTKVVNFANITAETTFRNVYLPAVAALLPQFGGQFIRASTFTSVNKFVCKNLILFSGGGEMYLLVCAHLKF